MTNDRRGPEQKQQRYQDHKIADAETESGITPAELGDHEAKEIRHEALPDRSAGSHDTDRESFALVEPQAGERDHRREQGSKPESTDQKINEVEQPQFILPAQRDQPKGKRKCAKEADLAGADTVRQTTPDNAADGGTDGQKRIGHRDVGAKPSEFLFEGFHKHRYRDVRAKAQRKTCRRHADNYPAIRPFVEAVASSDAQCVVLRRSLAGFI